MSGLAQLLRRHREAVGLTQEELADRAQLSARTISDIERGVRSRVYPDTARRLSVALELGKPELETFVDVARGRRVVSREIPVTQPGVPRPLTALLGREQELSELVRDLDPASAIRLVTITGLGGVGKSRLALAAATELEPLYGGRIHMLPVVANQEPEHLLGALARSLGVSDRASLADVGAHLSGGPTLLLLDSLEHVLVAADDLEVALMAVPDLRILATSRQRLGIAGEREIALMPFTVPDPSDPRWAESPATALFLERVRAHSPQLRIDAEVVIDVCRRVSGVPLALELAAARVRHLPPTVLRDRLRRGVGDLEDAGRGADRQRSMAQVLAWSIATLNADERLVLRVASLFVAGWRLDAAARLCGEHLDVVRATSGLVDRSLVMLDRSPEGPVDVPRWRMLDVVREFVRGQDSQAVPADLRRTYVDFYVELVAHVQQHLGREHEWFQLLATEEPNIRTALTWAAEARDAESVLRLAGGVWHFWQARGGLAEGREWLGTGLSMTPPAEAVTRMTAWWGVGWLAYHQGDDTAAEAAAQELEELAHRHQDAGALRNALTIHGMVAIARETTADASRLLGEALSIAQGLGSGWILATSLLNLGLAHLAAVETEQARRRLAEALAAYEDLADERFRARCLGYLGLVSLLENDPVRARALYQQSLAVFGRLAEPGGTAEGLAGMAAVEASLSHAARAALLAGAGERLFESHAGRALPLERRTTARYLSSAKQLLGSEAWSAEWHRGRELPLADALELALASSSASAG
ncbi:MAG TPA: helix-turn-helix domain-containing protein [Nocardioides sp.]|uniref:ATP-binding protein n=1 Tax=Nocardioides sp. TaxID=35761 RepID=UPI002F3E714D